MAIPHTVVAGIAKPAQPGWILFHGMRSHYWHWLTAEWKTPCQSTRIVKPSDILEWRPEPKGRWEVCPDCRRHLQREEQRLKAAASQSLSLPELRTEPVGIEPEVITAEHIPFVPPITATPKAPSVSNGPPPKTASIIPVAPFAKQHGFSYTQIMVFVAQFMPDLPRYHKAMLLDDAAQKRILKEFPPWVAARNLENQRKSRESSALARAKRIDNGRAKHAAAAIQAKALTTFQSQHVTPAGNVERVMAAIAEVKELVLMLAEDVAKLQAEAKEARVNASQDGDA